MPPQLTNITGFTATKIVIIESIPARELKSGSLVFEFIQAQIEQNGLNIALELFTCPVADDFRHLLAQLTDEALKTGHAPILQIECHGDQFDGLVFSDNSFITWPDVAEILTNLNRACRFNLLAIFSACFSGHFIGEIDALTPAPCWCMIAPTHTVDPAEIMQVIRTFYMVLMQTADAGRAIKSIRQLRMQDGRWFGQSAELWFERLTLGYIADHCTRKMARIRARKQFREIKREGKYVSIGQLKRMLKRQNKDILSRLFDTFFMIDDIPGNRQRFTRAHNRIQHKISVLQSTRKYVL